MTADQPVDQVVPRAEVATPVDVLLAAAAPGPDPPLVSRLGVGRLAVRPATRLPTVTRRRSSESSSSTTARCLSPNRRGACHD